MFQHKIKAKNDKKWDENEKMRPKMLMEFEPHRFWNIWICDLAYKNPDFIAIRLRIPQCQSFSNTYLIDNEYLETLFKYQGKEGLVYILICSNSNKAHDFFLIILSPRKNKSNGKALFIHSFFFEEAEIKDCL